MQFTIRFLYCAVPRAHILQLYSQKQNTIIQGWQTEATRLRRATTRQRLVDGSFQIFQIRHRLVQAARLSQHVCATFTLSRVAEKV